MSEWTACVFGELAFPDGSQPTWLKRLADPANYRDWLYTRALPDAELVSKLLKSIEQLGRRGNYVALEITPRRVTIRALFEGETDFWCQTIALALREAAAAGATGVVTFVDATEPALDAPLEGSAFRLDVAPSRSRFRRLRNAEATAVANDPAVLATAIEIIDKHAATPKRAKATPRRQRIEAAAVRGATKRDAADRKRAALDPGGAATALAKAVRAPLRTSNAANKAEGFVAKIVAAPSERGEQAIRDAWRALIARKPGRFDHELKLRLVVGKAVLRLGLPAIKDTALRNRLRAPTRKEWPDERELRAAVASLERLENNQIEP